MNATPNGKKFDPLRDVQLVQKAVGALAERGIRAISFTGSTLRTVPEIHIEQPDQLLAEAGVFFMHRRLEKAGKSYSATMYQSVLFGCRIVWVDMKVAA